MDTFVTFTNKADGDPLIVNASRILCVRPLKSGGSSIYVSGGEMINIQETHGAVLEMLAPLPSETWTGHFNDGVYHGPLNFGGDGQC